jgi:hypothetical protein
MMRGKVLQWIVREEAEEFPQPIPCPMSLRYQGRVLVFWRLTPTLTTGWGRLDYVRLLEDLGTRLSFTTLAQHKPRARTTYILSIDSNIRERVCMWSYHSSIRHQAWSEPLHPLQNVHPSRSFCSINSSDEHALMEPHNVCVRPDPYICASDTAHPPSCKSHTTCMTAQR